MTPVRLEVAGAVATAIAAGRPVVALETTLVTHGLPSPHGLRVAAALEQVGPCLRRSGSSAVRCGSASPETNSPNWRPPTPPRSIPASTTVAATLFAAAKAGIRVFATGGIGGVHRDAAESGDMSADLPALARHPVAVVCAGAKAILDLPRTRELLETLGVPVLGLGTDEFPAFYRRSFYRRSSGLAVDARCDSPAAAAAAIAAHVALGLPGGLVVANPIPPEHELPQDVHDAALAGALADAATAGIRGRGVTPFLLERMRVLTGDASLAANEALLVHNARTAAQRRT